MSAKPPPAFSRRSEAQRTEKSTRRIKLKRAYDPPASGDGRRILVDRLWPRGLTKDALKLDFWAKALAPSDELRRWYDHSPERWPEFRRRYFAELDANAEQVDELMERLGEGTATLVFGAKEERLNNAAALKEYLESRTSSARGASSTRRPSSGRRGSG